jgi:hypothetical protein
MRSSTPVAWLRHRRTSDPCVHAVGQDDDDPLRADGSALVLNGLPDESACQPQARLIVLVVPAAVMAST